MADYSDSNLNATQQKIALGKILLRQFQMLSGFHQLQLENYPRACCNISVHGEAEVDPIAKTVAYYLFTSKYYTIDKSGNLKRRSKYSLYSWLGIPDVRYKKEQDLAVKNLTSWTKSLLWDETAVKVYFDVQPTRE
jgi:hypothetical protein